MGGKAEEVDGEAWIYERQRWLLNAVVLGVSGTQSIRHGAATYVVDMAALLYVRCPMRACPLANVGAVGDDKGKVAVG